MSVWRVKLCARLWCGFDACMLLSLFCMSSSLSEWRRRVSRRGCSYFVLLQEYRGLKEGCRGGGVGGCMEELALLPCERRSIVPGTFQWLPRGPCSNPSPHHSQSLTLILKKQKLKKKTQAMRCLLLNTPFGIFLFLSSLMFSSFYKSKLGLSLCLARLRFLIISPHWCDCHAAKIA